MSWQTLLAVGSGGFIGAILRTYLNGLISSKVQHTLPFGTLGVNLIGSFIIGMLFAFFLYTTIFSTSAKSFLSTGILGALTTYSTFAIESFLLLNQGQIALGFANMFLNTLGSVMMAGLGYLSFSYLLK